MDLRRDAEEALRRCREAGARLPAITAGGGSGGEQQQGLPVPTDARGAPEGAVVVEVQLGGGGEEEAERLQQQLMESPEALLARQLASSSSGPAGRRRGRGGARARGAGQRGARRRPESAQQLSKKGARGAPVAPFWNLGSGLCGPTRTMTSTLKSLCMHESYISSQPEPTDPKELLQMMALTMMPTPA